MNGLRISLDRGTRELNCLSYFLLFILLPSLPPTRPAYATPKLLDRVGMTISDIDVFEYHEAFAVSNNCGSRKQCGRFWLHDMESPLINLAVRATTHRSSARILLFVPSTCSYLLPLSPTNGRVRSSPT